MVALIIFGIAAAIASLAQGGFDFMIALQFVPLLSIPIVLSALAKSRKGTVFIIIAVVALSGPSLFVLPYHSISSTTVYPSEFAIPSFYLHYTPSNATPIMADAKTFAVVSAEQPLINGNIYNYPIHNLGYNPSDYNIINLVYTTYQLHLYGYPINISSYYNNDITFNDGTVFIAPPS